MAKKKEEPAQETEQVDLETVLRAMARIMQHQSDLLQELLDRVPPRVKLGS